MKRIILALCLIILFSGFCFAQVEEFVFEEIYVSYYPADNYARIIEYNILHKSNTNALIDDVNHLLEFFVSAEYANNKYRFKYFYGVEESISNEGHYIKGVCDLLTNEKPSMVVIRDLFENILKRKVDVKYENNRINLYFDGTDISVKSNNAEGVYSNGDQIKISWSNRINKIEVVFGMKSINITEPIIQHISGKVSSVEKSEEEIDFLKNSSPPLGEVEQAFQDDCDIIRLQHIKYYADLIEEYKHKKGYYPFQGKYEVPLYSFIANKQQTRYVNDNNPNNHRTVSCKEFIEELEIGLGYDIEQKYDPQYVPSGRPVFYIYMITGDIFYFAVHVSKYYNFTNKITNNYYKAEVSNITNASRKIYSIIDLLKNNQYSSSIQSMPTKFDFFIDREKKHINEY